jgi:hypothetical protein
MLQATPVDRGKIMWRETTRRRTRQFSNFGQANLPINTETNEYDYPNGCSNHFSVGVHMDLPTIEWVSCNFGGITFRRDKQQCSDNSNMEVAGQSPICLPKQLFEKSLHPELYGHKISWPYGGVPQVLNSF